MDQDQVDLFNGRIRRLEEESRTIVGIHLVELNRERLVLTEHGYTTSYALARFIRTLESTTAQFRRAQELNSTVDQLRQELKEAEVGR
jgi:hypothetical protein